MLLLCLTVVLPPEGLSLIIFLLFIEMFEDPNPLPWFGGSNLHVKCVVNPVGLKPAHRAEGRKGI